jgi:hypothetical protein
VRALLAYAASTRLPYRVTSTYRPNTDGRRSYHGARGTDGDGLAVDFAGTSAGVTAETARQMVDLWRAFRYMAPHLAELIYAGSGVTEGVLNGRLVGGLATYGRDVWAAHRDHVHVSVPRGVFLSPKLSQPPVTLEVRPMWDPPLAVVDFLPYWNGSGGYMLFADGGVGAVGDAPYRPGAQPFGNDYWLGRRPARLERLGTAGYTVIATSGERYEYPAGD